MKHRGRIQAQGKHLEASESWSQEEPITKEEGLEMLDNLKHKIPKKEAQIRKKAFHKAENFIKDGGHEVISAPITRSFKVKGTQQERVDIEIQKGQAFN